MYIGLLKTSDNQIAVEFITIDDAFHFLNNMIEKYKESVKQAVILEELTYLDDQRPDFSSCKEIISLRTIR